ncbi:hypothetical protein [Nitrosospira sp. Nsp14]|uniref:hypothetical protein n=1 Tax=Nitrosospira sp. Nsp14 TaxID=1855333 RepID=UPI001160B294|nr:hypothetical protein [Nitrosospira sp. Nsp14]
MKNPVSLTNASPSLDEIVGGGTSRSIYFSAIKGTFLIIYPPSSSRACATRVTKGQGDRMWIRAIFNYSHSGRHHLMASWFRWALKWRVNPRGTTMAALTDQPLF